MDGSALEEKSLLKMLWLTLSSKLDWGSYIISTAKTASKIIGALIPSMKFLSPDVALYLYKSTIHPCLEYCCQIWAGAPGCYNEYAGLLVLHLLFLLNPWLIVEIWPPSVFSIGITLVDVLQNWLNWLHFLFLEGGPLVILIDCIIFLSPFLDATRMSVSTVSFLAQLDSGILCL